MSEPWEDADTGVGKRGIGIESPSGGRLQGIPVRFGRVHALLLVDAELLLAAGRTSWGSYSLPDPQQRAVAGAGQTVDIYTPISTNAKLISMPTGTSTIFGVFQLIRLLPSSVGTMFVPASKLG